ncbi:ABC transporter ATP-binding protein [Solwaraspora sp. WMMD791]|uniref:ABC transporter transmembrane domain-containing protein n=1 Tax=Solwaraspora sp. WMMD791 TaxID=3016086 RepID=UPI00249A668A|nr:ABC transporter ATP-binding protein [Solwaraspora sp. WMMD791]WFE25060.1 ABC transporter ATP-binding protein [Solwaraspora sp. WMMD791]
MWSLPVADPGVADHRSAARLLRWLTGRARLSVAAGAALSIVWMGSQALMPAVVGRAIDAGLTAGDLTALLGWAAVLLGLGLVQAGASVSQHWFGVLNWLSTAYRTVQLTVRQANRLGATLPKRLATGEVVSIGTADMSSLGGAVEAIARAIGAAAAIVVVAVILVGTSTALGLVIVIGVPVLVAVIGLGIRPLHHRQQTYRDQQATLATLAGDIVVGLRILRGVGGEAVLAGSYRDQSQELRRRGSRLAGVESVLEAAQLLLPGMFLVLVTWLGARLTVAGELTVGQLVASYAYTAFLVGPIRTVTEFIHTITRGHVAARRVAGLLAIDPEFADPPAPRQLPAADGDLVDVTSGLRVASGRTTAVAATAPQDVAALADRLGRYRDAEVTYSGVPLRELDLATVRQRILVADNDARLFTGRLRDELDATGQASDDAVRAALVAASATDIVDALPHGLDTEVAERGREFSGGQQQRLRLARALLADPPVLVLVEPTSAVDAHTEVRIAARLRAARAGRTTVVCTTSPLLLEHADRVVFLDDGKVLAEGSHAELLRTEPRYAALVTRAEPALLIEEAS